MKTTVSFNDFQDTFRRFDRQNQFSRFGLRALFDHIEELEESTGEEYELDVIALCCDFAEFDTAEDAAREYGWTPENGDNPLEWLQEQTSVIEVHGYPQVIVQSF
jgi:hypothetical protein